MFPRTTPGNKHKYSAEEYIVQENIDYKEFTKGRELLMAIFNYIGEGEVFTAEDFGRLRTIPHGMFGFRAYYGKQTLDLLINKGFVRKTPHKNRYILSGEGADRAHLLNEGIYQYGT